MRERIHQGRHLKPPDIRINQKDGIELDGEENWSALDYCLFGEAADDDARVATLKELLKHLLAWTVGT